MSTLRLSQVSRDETHNLDITDCITALKFTLYTYTYHLLMSYTKIWWLRK